MNLLSEVRGLFEPALMALAPDAASLAKCLSAINPTKNAAHGDYEAKFAPQLAAALKKPNSEAMALANQVLEMIGDDPMVESFSTAGLGFINIKLKDSWIAEQVRVIAADERLGAAKAAPPKTFVIDYSGPNVAKPLHVGHLRSTIIGDALVRILRFLGHTVVGDNHLGDWGTQFGMLIYGYRNFLDAKAFEKDPVRELARLYIQVRSVKGTIDILSKEFTHFRDAVAFAADPLSELARLYVEGLKRATVQTEDDDEDDKLKFPNAVADAYRAETAKLHAGDPENVALWQQFMPHCLDMLKPIYEWLDVKIDHALGESFYNPLLPGVVESLMAKGIAVESNGALVVPNAKGIVPTAEEMAKEEPPALVRKRDGAFTYTTTDLATVQYRLQTWKPDVILYVVDARQALHFKTLFANAKRWLEVDAEMLHLSFGSVLDKDGKPFAARKGGAPELTTLLDEAVAEGLKKYEENYAKRKAEGHDVPDLTAERKKEIAEAVGFGAVKYADLSGNRTSDYKFDLDKMLATTGNTATYMQYAYARCRSIFRKGNADESAFRTTPPAVLLTHAAERALALQLLKFPDVLAEVQAKYEPHHIAAYLWDLSKAFSGFFENCPVLTASSEELKASRLLLTDLTARTIRTALDLLGIRVVERM